MTHLFFAVGRDVPCQDWLERGLATYEKFKQVRLARPPLPDGSVLGVAARTTGAGGDGSVFRDGVWVGWAGTWIHPDVDVENPAEWLAEAWESRGSNRLARELSGQFALFRVARDGRSLEVITDRCGSLHVFETRCANGLRVSVSSAALGDPLQLDPASLNEYLATGNVYGLRTLWADVRKLPPASICLLDVDGVCCERYWDFSALIFGRDSLADSVVRLGEALAGEIRAISRQYPRLLTDLTGGYDSRLLLAGLIDGGARFSSTVTGLPGDGDVRVAADLANTFGIDHHPVAKPPVLRMADWIAAVRLVDGEADAFEYSDTAKIHGRTAGDYSAAVGGSFGEIARGYWWELLWPSIGRRMPLDPAMLSRKRFAAVPHDSSVLLPSFRLDLANHMAGVLKDALDGHAHLPNTAQMDWIYFSVRMQRWQGRLASSTAQLRSYLSPLSAWPVLECMLEARPDSRLRSRLIREFFVQRHPRLAAIPLEQGYCPRPFRWTHPADHWSLVGHYAGKVRSKLSAMAGTRSGRSSSATIAAMDIPGRFPAMWTEGLAELLGANALMATGLFDEQPLRAKLDSRCRLDGHALVQWQRLVTLEQCLRLMR